MPRQNSTKKPSFGVLFWIAFILFVAILYLANHQRIQEVLQRTEFVDIVFEDPAETPADSPEEDVDTEPIVVETPELAPEPGDPAVEEDADEVPQEIEEPVEPDVVAVDPIQTDQPSIQGRSSLFFIRVSNDGRILAEEVVRPVEVGSAPLTATLEALLSGPSGDDLNAGLLSLIPEGTELLSARVAERVAFLNFNEAFRFNPMGLEGYMAQMQQIVLTATQFSTVDAVQILINGRTLDYLGGDGVYIGEPLAASELRR